MTTRAYDNLGEGRVARLREMPLTRLASRLLVVGFVLSAAYQLHRSTIMEVPASDRFDLPVAAIYALLTGGAIVAGTGRRWAPWLVVVLSFCFTLFGIFSYYPETTAARTFGPLDWAEGVLFCGLMFTSGVLSLCDLCGLQLTPRHHR